MTKDQFFWGVMAISFSTYATSSELMVGQVIAGLGFIWAIIALRLETSSSGRKARR